MVLRVEHGVLTLLGRQAPSRCRGGDQRGDLVGSLDDLNGLLAGNLHYEPARDFWGSGQPEHHHLGSGQYRCRWRPDRQHPDCHPGDGRAGRSPTGVGTPRYPSAARPWVPLNLSASVVNPAPGELSVRIQNLGNAQVVDEHGQSVGHADGNDWLLPMDQSVPIYLKDLPAGDHALTP